MTPVYLQEEYAKTEIAKILNVLDEELVGLVPVKSRIREIAALLLIDKLRVLVYICLLLEAQELVKQQ
jgi:hypothetical protein